MKQREAELFADIAHEAIGQRRKFTNDPYIVHPRNVAYLVKCAGGTDEMISAAFLHDVIEDVSDKIPSIFGLPIIKKQFGTEIFELVLWLTDKSVSQDGNREQRKEIDRNHISMAPYEAKTIKLADLIDNSLTIMQYDPGFAKIYLQEKRLLLSILEDGNKNLWNMANDILMEHGY